MIQVNDLTKYYDNLCAVNSINFTIRKGEILGLLGPNGAGKSTTLRMLTGYIRPSSGTIQVKDYTIHENLLEVKKLFGYLPESAPLYHDMLVYDYLNYVADIREIERANKLSRIKSLADLCGLNEVMHKPIGDLSKGYKQRVGLAHAMMSDPEILVLDEPTSGLDPNQIIEIRKIIKQIGKEKTIIFSTHILSEAEATCDRIVIINKGQVVADDSTDRLKHSAENEFPINLSLLNAEFNAVKGVLETVDGITNIAKKELGEANGDALNIQLICKNKDNIRSEIYTKIKNTDWILLDFHKETQTLEKIFSELTKEN